MIIYLSVLIALIGALVYAFSANPKIATLGLVAYGSGLLAFLLGLPGHSLSVLPK